jgi:DNA-directed RNA polymerase subunit RPC12/RpoP
MRPTEDAEAARGEANRQTRAENHAAKKAADWRCSECGTTSRILVVKAKTDGTLTTRCESCLDRRSFDVQPLQFDERERAEAAKAA